jgi:hypothetical protein
MTEEPMGGLEAPWATDEGWLEPKKKLSNPPGERMNWGDCVVTLWGITINEPKPPV